MDLLLDTCALIFFLEDDPRLPPRVAKLVEDPANRCHVSLISLWEMSLKCQLGKLRCAYALRDDLPELLQRNGFHLLPVAWPSLRHSTRLPWLHRDPFDRILLAEALQRDLPIVSSDGIFESYGVRRLWD